MNTITRQQYEDMVDRFDYFAPFRMDAGTWEVMTSEQKAEHYQHGAKAFERLHGMKGIEVEEPIEWFFVPDYSDNVELFIGAAKKK